MNDEVSEDSTAPVESVRTGHDGVDGVLGSLDGLDDAAVATHVAVFERAHEQMRGALDNHRG